MIITLIHLLEIYIVLKVVFKVLKFVFGKSKGKGKYKYSHSIAQKIAILIGSRIHYQLDKIRDKQIDKGIVPEKPSNVIKMKPKVAAK